MARESEQLRYIITTNPRLDGVGLSKCGHWGGKRFPDDASAIAAAILDAGSRPCSIERETAKKRFVKPE